ncbi:MAG: sensor histidine kinase [Sulfitobacter sp.]|nr:sensor histidine kinase [Sulfitobacter sp.]
MLHDTIYPETEAVYGGDSASLGGPEIRVNSQTTLALGMAIHEMATNTARYGAFSTDDTHVDMSCSRINDAAGDRLRIEW